MKTRSIERRRLGTQVFEVLKTGILKGHYIAGQHLSEINICTEMGVSRTPVREALFKLEETGLVISHPNRGFFVAPLDKSQVQDRYPILASLEALALKLSPTFSGKAIATLAALNSKMRESNQDSMTLYQLDFDFHEKLIATCPNKSLLQMITDLKSQNRRFDGGYKRGLAAIEASCQEHEEIIAAVERGDNNEAAALLEAHWYSGIAVVNNWIDSQEEDKEHDTPKTA